MRTFIIALLMGILAPVSVAHAASTPTTEDTVVSTTTTVPVLVINGPATVIGSDDTPAPDVCLDSHDPFNPGHGTMSRSLLPCSISFILEPEINRTPHFLPSSTLHAATGTTLPATGTDIGTVYMAVMLVLLGLSLSYVARKNMHA